MEKKATTHDVFYKVEHAQEFKAEVMGDILLRPGYLNSEWRRENIGFPLAVVIPWRPPCSMGEKVIRDKIQYTILTLPSLFNHVSDFIGPHKAFAKL